MPAGRQVQVDQSEDSYISFRLTNQIEHCACLPVGRMELLAKQKQYDEYCGVVEFIHSVLNG